MEKRKRIKSILILTSYLWFLILSFLAIKRWIDLPISGKIFVFIIIFLGTFSPLMLFMRQKFVVEIEEKETIYKKLLLIFSNTVCIFLVIFGISHENWYLVAGALLLYVLSKLFYIFN